MPREYHEKTGGIFNIAWQQTIHFLQQIKTIELEISSLNNLLKFRTRQPEEN